MSKNWRLLLGIAATDDTFERVTLGDGRRGWAGKCIHCRARLVIAESGEPISRVTVEHIVPRAAGGSDDLDNLAAACARCNSEKGVRHDARTLTDPRARALVDRLLQRRRDRWRDPDAT